MIIKRRVTRSFVQIANDVVRDRRLALDEHGLLHYLLSLPDDWEVNLRQIEAYWNIGRDRRRRLFRALQKTGWARLERIEDDNGTFLGQRWIIGDDPGAEITDEVIDAANSADESDEPESLATTMNTTAAPESQAPDALVSGHRETGSQAVGSPDGRETRPPEKASLPRRKKEQEYLQNTNTMVEAVRENDEAADAACEPPPRFGELLRLWPSENVASGFASERSFNKLSEWQRRQAFHAIKSYLADCRSKGQTRLCDLRTYLDERRFEKFTATGTVRQRYFAAPRTPQWYRWRDHYKAVGGPWQFMERQAQSGSGFTVPQEWPGPIDPDAKAQPQAQER